MLALSMGSHCNVYTVAASKKTHLDGDKSNSTGGYKHCNIVLTMPVVKVNKIGQLKEEKRQTKRKNL